MLRYLPILVLALPVWGQQTNTTVLPPETPLPSTTEATGLETPVPGSGSAPAGYQANGSNSGRSTHQLIFAPIPVANQALGFGIAPLVTYVFTVGSGDRKSQPSSIDLAGYVSANKSWALG